MFGKKNVVTFVDGKSQKKDVVSEKLSKLEIPLPDKQDQNQENDVEQQQSIPECLICGDYGFYGDANKVCRVCPRCNPGGKKFPNEKIK